MSFLCLLLGIAWCSPDPLDLTLEYMFDRCLLTMESAEEPNVAWLRRVPIEEAGSGVPKRTAAVWRNLKKPLYLYQLRSEKDGTTDVGCAVEYRSYLNTPLPFELADLEERVVGWFDLRKSVGRYKQVEPCPPNTEDQRTLVFEFLGETESSKTLRVVASFVEQIDFFIFIAAQSPVMTDGCSSK